MAEEQERKLVEVLSILGDLVDVEMAKVLLESADWDVERALGGALDNPETASITANADAGDQVDADGTQASGHHNPSSTRGIDEHSQGEISLSASDIQEEDLCTLSIADLKAMLDVHEVDHASCVEKSELIALLQTAMRQHRRSTQFESCAPRDLSPEEQAQLEAERQEQERISAERRAEIAVQDAEFQESLLMDQMRQAERRDAEEAELQVKEAERLSAEEAHRVETQRKEAFEVKRRRVEHPEPAKSDPDRCQLLVRVPSGKRFSRVFRGSDEVSFLYDWIDVACAEEEFTKEPYCLVFQVPGQRRRELRQRELALKEEGLEHQTMLFVDRCA